MYGTNDIAEMVNRYKPSTENKPEEIQNTINYIKQQLGKDTFDLTNQKDVYSLISKVLSDLIMVLIDNKQILYP